MQTSSIVRLIALIALIAAAVAALVLLPITQLLTEFLEWLQQIGPWGPVLAALAYIPASLFFLPGWLITVGAGFAFGVLRASVAVSLGSVLGASAAFWAGRTLARGFVEHRLAHNPRFRAIDEAVGREGFKIVLLCRLSPIIPFNL